MERITIWLLLGLTLLTVSLYDVHGETEVGPSETECRPYIEKAIHELKSTDSSDGENDSSEPDTPNTAPNIDDDDDDDDNDNNNNNNDDIDSKENNNIDSNEKNLDSPDDNSNENTSAEVDLGNDDDNDKNDDGVDDDNDDNDNDSEATVNNENQSKEIDDKTNEDNSPDSKEDDNKSGEEIDNDTDDSKENNTEENKDDDDGDDDDNATNESNNTKEDDSIEEQIIAENENQSANDSNEHKTDDVDNDDNDENDNDGNNDGDNNDDGDNDDNDKSTEHVEDSNENDKDSNEQKSEEKQQTRDDDGDDSDENDSKQARSKRDVDSKPDDDDSHETKEENKSDEADDDNQSIQDNNETDEVDSNEVVKPVDDNDASDDDNDKENDSKVDDVIDVDSTEDDKDDDDKDSKESKEKEKAESSKEVNEKDDTDNDDDNDEDDADDDNDDDDDNNSEEEKGVQSAESFPEDDLLMEYEIPKNLRDTSHIAELLHLDDESEESELAVNKVADVILRDLKKIYESAIKPLETLYKYRDLSNRHFGDPEIFSKPLVLFMGPWSGGKSTILNYLTNNEYTPNSLRTGAEPSPAYFNILMYGDEPEVLDGTQLAADWTFSGLQKFGQGLEDRLRGVKLPNKLLEKVNIVEIPGILEVRKQVSRLFPFNDACQWFIDRADIIFLVYDPSKLDVGPETEAILDQLKGREYQTRIILNKGDQVKPEELMRVQGALIWNISPLMSSAQPPIMYTTSLWSHPYESGAPVRLLQAQERAFLRDLRISIDKRIDNKIASARRFAVRVRNHAKMVDCYLTTYYNHKSLFGNKKQISDQIIEHPQDYHIYEGLSTLTNISRYDLPDPDVYRGFFRLNPLYEFKKLSETCTYFRGCPINKLDVAIAYDLPELVGKYKKLAESALIGLDSDSTKGNS